MQRLTAIMMALVLLGSSATALADRDRDRHRGGKHGGHHGFHDKHHGKHHGYRGKYHEYRGKDYRHHGKRHVKHYVYYHSKPYHRSRAHYNYDPYLPLGAALVGTAVGFTLGHGHDNVTTTYTRSTTSNVTGCFRVERYPDGSERRVNLPPSECY